MTEEEKNKMEKDILFQIDMQLYDEFNDTIATMNDHLGDIYSLRDVEEAEKAEKEKEIKLLREAVKKLQADIEIKDKVIDLMAELIEECRQNECIEYDDGTDLSYIAGEKLIIDYFYKKVEEEK